MNRSLLFSRSLRLLSYFPSGSTLPEDVWQRRHRFLLALAWAHALVIGSMGAFLGYTWSLSPANLFRDGTVLHTIAEGLVLAAFAALAGWKTRGRSFRAAAVSLGLMTSSAFLVHLSGGYIEAHFHFFVMLSFLALYQDWRAYGLAIVYVALHHGIVGVMLPHEVYNHGAAIDSPWTWATLHTFFIFWACAGSIVAWRFNEKLSHHNGQIRTSLRAAENQFQQLFSVTPDVVYTLTSQGKLSSLNPAFETITGFSREEWLGKSFVPLVHPDDLLNAVSAFQRALRGEKQPPITIRFHAKAGHYLHGELTTTALIEQGRIVGVMGIARDVTDRTRAEELLEARQRELELVNEISQETLNSSDLQTLLGKILDKAMAIGPFDLGLVRLIDTSTGTIKPVTSRGYRNPESIMSHPLNAVLAGRRIIYSSIFQNKL